MAPPPMQALDNYYASITLLMSLAIQLVIFLVAFKFQTDRVTDLAGATNFLFIAILTFAGGEAFNARNILVFIFVTLWSLRLGAFQFLRVAKMGGDSRFDEMRSKPLNFGAFFLIQALWAWTVSLPETFLQSPNISRVRFGGGRPPFGSGTDIVGIIFWAIGFFFEAYGDQQKFIWKGRQKSKTEINTGFPYSLTRHPNYFGEILLWWGIWLLCIEPARSGIISGSARRALYASVLGPLFITGLLLFVSGMPTAEKPSQKKYFLMSNGPDAEDDTAWPRYKDYLNRTSNFFPIPASLYEPLPAFVKTYLLLDLPLYQFSEERDGKQAIEEAEKKKQKKSNESNGGA